MRTLDLIYSRPLKVALAVVAICAQVACGGGSGGSGSAASTTASDAGVAPAVTDTTVRDAEALAVSKTREAARENGEKTPTGGARVIYVDTNNPAATNSGAGSSAQPYRTIEQALFGLKPGDEIVIRPGIYREALIVPALPASGSTRTTIRAATPGTVYIKGSSGFGAWQPYSGDTWRRPWSLDEPEQVWRAGRALKQIGGTVFAGFPSVANHPLNGLHQGEGGIWPGRIAGGVGQLAPDSYTYDATAKMLYIRLSTPLSAGEEMEVSTARTLLAADGVNNLTIDGIVFEHSNTSYSFRQGAVRIEGNGNIVTNSTVHKMDSFCLQMNGNDNVIRNSIIRDCGQAGINVRGRRVTVTGNQILANNTRGFNMSWEAGGIKAVGDPHLYDSVISNNVVAYNKGTGIWVDWKNSNITIEGNTASYNSTFGIHYEASDRATIRSNIVYGNGQRGIYLDESANSLIEGNSVFSNYMEGIAILNGPRAQNDATLLPYGNIVRSNSIAWNDPVNYIQLILPGAVFGNVSDRNVFKTDYIVPRQILDFMTPTNRPAETLQQWQAMSGQDATSTVQLALPSAALLSGLQVQRIFTRAELPAFLQTPGN